MDSIMNEIAKNLIYYRKQKGMTQKELAKKIGVGNTTVSGWETGASSIDIDTLYSVCLVLGVSLGDMYGKYFSSSGGYTAEEKLLVHQYRSRPRMQEAVRILLGL